MAELLFAWSCVRTRTVDGDCPRDAAAQPLPRIKVQRKAAPPFIACAVKNRNYFNATSRTMMTIL
jgi:hypothetical protein